MSTTTDPFTQVHRGIWAALTGYDAWAAAVTAGNRVRFDEGQQFPANMTTGGQPADAPQVVLMQTRFGASQAGNSLACEITQTYVLALTGADLNIIPVNQVKWHTFRALNNAGHSLGLPRLVRNWAITEANDEMMKGAPEQMKGTKRCTAMLAITVQMFVSKVDVIAGTIPA